MMDPFVELVRREYGTRPYPNSARDRCPRCHGHGRLKTGATCGNCDGSGWRK